MHLLKQETLSQVLPAKQTFHVKLMKLKGHITLTVDDNVFMNYTDNGVTYGPVLEDGHIGLRQVYESAGYYDNFKLWDLSPEVQSPDSILIDKR